MVEEDLCRTVYDTVREKKCQMVNITLPHTECHNTQDLVMEQECKVVNTTVKTPVCATLMNTALSKVIILMC